MRAFNSVKETSITIWNIYSESQIFVEKFLHLFYNLLMKKLLFILLALFITNSAFGQNELFQEVTNQANILYAGNEINSALNLFLSIPEEERTAQNWLLIGNILQDQSKTDEAVFMYNKAIQTDDKYYKAYYNLGNIYLKDNKPNMAIEQYKQVIKLKPDYPYAHYNLGCAYIKLGKYSKAKYELLLATDYKNTVPDFHYNLAYVYKKLNKPKEAQRYIEYYNKLMENQ